VCVRGVGTVGAGGEGEVRAAEADAVSGMVGEWKDRGGSSLSARQALICARMHLRGTRVRLWVRS
jgi:hypothetical protein